MRGLDLACQIAGTPSPRRARTPTSPGGLQRDLAGAAMVWGPHPPVNAIKTIEYVLMANAGQAGDAEKGIHTSANGLNLQGLGYLKFFSEFACGEGGFYCILAR